MNPNSQRGATPRTDALIAELHPDPICALIDLGRLTRQLERELAERPSGPAGGVTLAMLGEACDIGLAIAGGLAPHGGDEWLANHEKRLRELWQTARASSGATPEQGA